MPVRTSVIVAIAVVLIVVAGVVGYFVGASTLPPTKTVTQTITIPYTYTVTQTVTVTPAPTTPTPTPTPTPTLTPMPKPVEKIKIALVFPLTGALATLGTEEANAAIMAIEMVNEKGGVRGIPVEYHLADITSDPAKAASEVERVILTYKPHLIIGTYSSALLLATSEVAERYGVPYMEVGAITEKATLRGYKYFFRPEIIGVDYGWASVQFIVEKVAPVLGKKPSEIKVAIIYEDGPYGTSVAAGNKVMVEKYGLQLVLMEAYSSKTTDLTPLILKLKATEPDIILATSYTSDAILFVRQAKELGLKVKVFIGHSAGWADTATWKALGTDIAYFFNVGPPTCWYNYSALKSEIATVVKEFINRWYSKYGHYPIVETMISFAHTYWALTDLLPRVIEKYGEPTPDNIIKAVWETDIPEGGTAVIWGIKFSTPDKPEDTDIGKIIRADKPQLHVNQNIRAFPVVEQWTPDGRLVVVWPDKYAYQKPVIPFPSDHWFYKP
jgi:branched-chain amino acid transport system substrate-binding protein